MTDLPARVYAAFDPAPLLPDQTDLYVDLDSARGTERFIRSLATTIRSESATSCQLVSGQRRSGKSTELRRLQRELERGEPRHFVVYCEVDKDLDLNDLDYLDVLIAVVRQTATQLKDRLQIELAPGAFRDRFERLITALGSVRIEGFEVGVGLGTGMFKLAAAFKGSPDARQHMRALLEPDTTNWLAAANDVIGEAKLKLRQKGCDDLVIIVDDLDRMVIRPHAGTAMTTAEYLFVRREAQLSGFACHVVYTIPLALAYSTAERVIAGLYGHPVPVVPMTKIREGPPARGPYQPGVDRFRELINARLKHANVGRGDLFSDDSVPDELIRLSGGQPGELMVMVREAVVSDELPVTGAAIQRVGRVRRRAYQRQLMAHHWQIIDEVRTSGHFNRTPENDATIRELLESRAILQYLNDDEWYGVNPVIDDIQRPA